MRTNLTRTWDGKRERDMTNRKPFRNKDQKRDAKRFATKRNDGAFRVSLADAGVCLHPANKQPMSEYR